ncbi:hypothetical protein DP939_21885 [Spongiactinospora rosea]|uniref:Uncharacterized protein n=1 Tax=Spongiactinospora rosea TaxID=2248750 RepID=A0A366LVP9_9ACTN|nr:hypothetical protein [Spongiactinospora rosea]RBQ18025.1 hypothetical protein DP939_21885 [Spongiactinospora rosea]
MALATLPLDDFTIKLCIMLAGSGWDRWRLDEVWRVNRLGGRADTSLPQQIFQNFENMLTVRGREMVALLHSDLPAVSGFCVPFALFYIPDDEDGPDVASLQDLQIRDPAWSFADTVRKGDFDEVWRQACLPVQKSLGVPMLTGLHADDEWHHAAWRIDDRLLVLAQAEDFNSTVFTTRRPSGWSISRRTPAFPLVTTCTTFSSPRPWDEAGRTGP